MFCPYCGSNNEDGVLYCASCEANLGASQQPEQPQAVQYQQAQPTYQQPVYQQPVYQQPAPVANDTVSVGQWVISLLLWCIPVVGFILTLVWAFSSGVNPNKRNFFRAILIFDLVAIVIGIAMGVLLIMFSGYYLY